MLNRQPRPTGRIELRRYSQTSDGLWCRESSSYRLSRATGSRRNCRAAMWSFSYHNCRRSVFQYNADWTGRNRTMLVQSMKKTVSTYGATEALIKGTTSSGSIVTACWPIPNSKFISLGSMRPLIVSWVDGARCRNFSTKRIVLSHEQGESYSQPTRIFGVQHTKPKTWSYSAAVSRSSSRLWVFRFGSRIVM